MKSDKKLAYGLLALVVVAAFASCDDKKSTGSTTASAPAAPYSNAGLSDMDKIREQAHFDATGEHGLPGEEKSASSRMTADQIRAKIQDFAVDEYTREEFPTLYKALGKAGAKDAQKGAWAAAYRVAQLADCDSVYGAAITNESTKKHQEYFANCENGKQWRFSAAELKDKAGKWYTADNAPAAGISKTDQRKAELADLQNSAPGGVIECKELLTKQLKFPSSADFHILTGTANFINPQDERAVQIEFDAKNDYGNELPYTGQCVFHKNGKVSVDMFNR